MSTPAIKTELKSLLTLLAPDKKWSKRAGIVQLSDFAVHRLDADSPDPMVLRAIELASVMYYNERSSK